MGDHVNEKINELQGLIEENSEGYYSEARGTEASVKELDKRIAEHKASAKTLALAGNKEKAIFFVRQIKDLEQVKYFLESRDLMLKKKSLVRSNMLYAEKYLLEGNTEEVKQCLARAKEFDEHFKILLEDVLKRQAVVKEIVSIGEKKLESLIAPSIEQPFVAVQQKQPVLAAVSPKPATPSIPVAPQKQPGFFGRLFKKQPSNAVRKQPGVLAAASEAASKVVSEATAFLAQQEQPVLAAVPPKPATPTPQKQKGFRGLFKKRSSDAPKSFVGDITKQDEERVLREHAEVSRLVDRMSDLVAGRRR
ncbi:MAG: hypothetical protein LBH46_02215 [Rickettsiales bacterium]|jgi:hypothetical protein|nr:hypothetical protein [Rickettsiales bacterium]